MSFREEIPVELLFKLDIRGWLIGYRMVSPKYELVSSRSLEELLKLERVAEIYLATSSSLLLDV